MKNNKKGFTIVELVIVIAVIAILASVLVPTFSNVITKAQRSADVQLVKNINTALQIELSYSEKSKYDTLSETLYALEDSGYNVERICAKSDYNIAWDSQSGLFVLILNMYDFPIICYPTENGDEEVRIDINNEDQTQAEHKAVDYFVITKSNEFNQEDNKNYRNPYSIYAYDDGGWGKDKTDIIVNTGFDTGKVKTFNSITYVNDPLFNVTPQNAIIRINTFDTKLEVYAPQDTIDFYGYCAVLNVEAIANRSFHINGIVGRFEINQGRAVVSKDARVYCLMENPSSINSVYPTAIEDGAMVSLDEDSKSDVTKEYNGVAGGEVKDCGVNRHTNSVIINDCESNYEICTSCGYTLVTVQDYSGNSVKATGNYYNPSTDEIMYEYIMPKITYRVKEFLNQIIDSIEGSRSVDLSNFDFDEDVFVGSSTIETTNYTCIHEFEKGQLLKESTCVTNGEMLYTCKYCNAKLYENLALNGQNHNGMNRAIFNIFGSEFELNTNYCQACQLPTVNVQSYEYPVWSQKDDDRNSDITYQFSFFDKSYCPIEISIFGVDRYYYSLDSLMQDIGFSEETINWLVFNFNQLYLYEALEELAMRYLEEHVEDLDAYGFSFDERIAIARNVIEIYMTNFGYKLDESSGALISQGSIDYLSYQIMFVAHFDEDIDVNDQWTYYMSRPSNWNDFYIDYDTYTVDEEDLPESYDASNNGDGTWSYSVYHLEDYYDINWHVDVNTTLKAGDICALIPLMDFFDDDSNYLNTWGYLYNGYYSLFSKMYKRIGLETKSASMIGKTITIDMVLYDAHGEDACYYVIGSFEYTFDTCARQTCYDYYIDEVYHKGLLKQNSYYLVEYINDAGHKEYYYALAGGSSLYPDYVWSEDWGYSIDINSNNRTVSVVSDWAGCRTDVYDYSTTPLASDLSHVGDGYRINVYELTPRD